MAEPSSVRSPRAAARASVVSWGREEFVVVSVPSLSGRLPESLTLAERHVAELLLEGSTSQQIAKRRGTSVRTVANQTAAIFRKIGVHRRAQLAEALGARE